ncbi:hypothetical protein [Paenibacillus sp. MY03]|nr:hypothetical protein [Paenibacillus sp. MY03]
MNSYKGVMLQLSASIGKRASWELRGALFANGLKRRNGGWLWRIGWDAR